MAAINQLSFGDGLFSRRKKVSKMSKKLAAIDQLIDWQPLVDQIAVVDKTDPKTGGRPFWFENPNLWNQWLYETRNDH